MSHVCLYQATWQNDFIKSSLCESTPSTTILLFHHALYTLLRNNNKHDPALVRGLPVNSWIIDIVFCTYIPAPKADTQNYICINKVNIKSNAEC